VVRSANLSMLVYLRYEEGTNARSPRFTQKVLHCPDNPNHAEAHDALGAVFYQSGRFSEVVAEFTETVRLKPDLAGVRDNLELARRAAGISK